MHDTTPHPIAADDGAADHLRGGMGLPCVSLPATSGPAIVPGELRGWTVLFVYPWTGRPGQPNPPDWDEIPGAHGSTPEIERFRDLAAEFRGRGAALFGLSGQTTDYQREMSDRLRVSFPILSDAEGQLARALQLPTFRAGDARYLTRLTLVLKDGAIERVFYPVPKPEAHADQVLDWLKRRVA